MPDAHDTNFLAAAATAVDAARVLDLPDVTPDGARAALDAAHALLIAAHRLFDALAHPGSAAAVITPDALPHLQAARDHLWHTADQVHLAYHHAPLPGDWSDAARPATPRARRDAAACRRGLPEGAPELTTCRRHQQAGARVRHTTTPADLGHRRITGTVRHRPAGQEGTAA